MPNRYVAGGVPSPCTVRTAVVRPPSTYWLRERNRGHRLQVARCDRRLMMTDCRPGNVQREGRGARLGPGTRHRDRLRPVGQHLVSARGIDTGHRDHAGLKIPPRVGAPSPINATATADRASTAATMAGTRGDGNFTTCCTGTRSLRPTSQARSAGALCVPRAAHASLGWEWVRRSSWASQSAGRSVGDLFRSLRR